MIGAPKKATMDWFSQTLSQWLRNRQTLSNWARFHGWEGKSPKQDVRTRFITWSKSKIHQGLRRQPENKAFGLLQQTSCLRVRR